MKKIIEKILNGDYIFKSDPTSITLIEWFAKENGIDPLSLYRFNEAKRFHENSLNRVHSKWHYMDFNDYLLTDYHETTYFDDLSFKQELQVKPILIQTKKFLQTKKAELTEETLNKLLHLINEIERNIRNHAYLTNQNMRITYAGNFYKISDEIDKNYFVINISDYGIGFEERREDNRSFSYLHTQGKTDTKHFVLDAVEKGVTTYSNINKVTNEGNRNSGYGLYLLNKVASENFNKLDILSDGKLFSNPINEKKLRYIGKWDEFKGITSITISFRISTLNEVFEKISKEDSAFSAKSKYKPLDV